MHAAEGYFLLLPNHVWIPGHPGLRTGVMKMGHTGRMIMDASVPMGKRMLRGPLRSSDVTVARAEESWREWSMTLSTTLVS